VDGVNINENQAWVCRDADDYVSNLFAAPYEELSYINHNGNGYAAEMGLDADLPFAEFPISVTGGADTKYYCDYYYQATGQRIARVGGHWAYGSSAGLSFWRLYYYSSTSSVALGARLLKKAL
jgi:hypothetical protein